MKNPAIRCQLPPKKAKEMQVLTHDEMQRFLIQAKHDGYYEIFMLDLATGLRRGELMGLQWSDLNFSTGELRIQRQVGRIKGKLQATDLLKTQSSGRTIVLPPSVVRILKVYQPTLNGSKWLFPSPVKEDDSPRDPHSIYSKMQKVLDRAECKRVRFHDPAPYLRNNSTRAWNGCQNTVCNDRSHLICIHTRCVQPYNDRDEDKCRKVNR